MSMNNKLALLIIGGSFIAAGMSFAQAPAGAPAGSTGLCKDGTYSQSASKSGACRGHKGVQTWYAAAAAPAPAAAMKAATPAPAPAAAMKAAAPTSAMKAAAPAMAPAKPAATPVAMAPGGGAGQVWVNTASKVYHCQGDKYYGKTKAGSYMTEAAAIAAGNHADHGKACK
jgi:hypothetical protein